MEFLPIWDVRVTIDLFLGGVGIGAFLWSVLASFRNREGHRAIVRIGALLAPVTVGLGLAVLMTKLGRPHNLLATATGGNPESMMFLGMILQGAFMLVAVLYALFLWRRPESFDFRLRVIQHTGVVLALAVGLYHGLLLSGLERPLWSDVVPVAFFVSSMVTGLAAILLIKTLVYREMELNSGFLRFAMTLLTVQFLVVLMWQYLAVRSGLEAQLSYQFLMSQLGGWWWLALIGGVILPGGLMVAALLTRKPIPHSRGLLVAASLLILVGAFGLKHLLILGGQVAVPIEIMSSF